MDTPQPWFVPFARNVTSQFGEDGIVEEIFRRVGVANRWCAEFGAADGAYCSNTSHLIGKEGFSAVLIEGSPAAFAKLQQHCRDNPRAHLINAYVGFDADNRLDALLRSKGAPPDLDLLSIDIDGNDYHIWESLQEHRPRIVIIEFNPTIPSQVEFVQPRDMGVSQGCSLRSLVHLGRAKGYELAAVTEANGIFVHAPLYARLGVVDNSIPALRVSDKAVTYLFTGYDGRVFLRGGQRLPWHRLSLKEARFQVLPWFLRRYPGNYNILQRWLAALHRSLYKKRII